jgi:small redox-active disulfide protein 2
MKNIKVLGSGCANCQTTARLIQETARELGVEIELKKVEEIGQIMNYGVMSTPGVVVDGTLVHAGSVPDRKTIEAWLAD